jgi:membrane-associated protease RseP (regulator of RpoE activity)
MALLLYPLSIFYAPKACAQVQEDPNGTRSGIGVGVQQQNNKFYVVSVIPGSPAVRAGILTGDIISTVDGKATGGMTLAQLMQAVTGPKGTHVQIGVTREGQPNPLVFEVVRDEIPNSVAGQNPPGVPAAQASDNPADPHDPGVYMMVAAPDGKVRMAPIQEVQPGNTTLGVGSAIGMAFSFGLSKAKITTDIPGPHAAVRTREKAPVFYMYFPSADYLKARGVVTISPVTVFGTIVAPSNIVSSPAQFSLLLLEEKKDHRETVVGKLGLGSEKNALDARKTIKFNAEMIRPNVYKATPESSLKPGEYAFVAASGGTTVVSNVEVNNNDLDVTGIVVYDFGIDQ